MNKLKEIRVTSRTSWRGTLLIVGLLALAGCATPAIHQSMTPTEFEVARKHPASVNLITTGGQETEAGYKSRISDEAFAKALTHAIIKSQVFSQVVSRDKADFFLTVQIYSIDQPSFGLTYQVKMEVGWILQRADTGEVVWREAILSQYTAEAGEAFVAAKRLRLATEGAARNNIQQALERISSLAL